MSAHIRVVNRDNVTVPCGAFEAYEVVLTFLSESNTLPKHTFWVATEGDRKVVKYENQGYIAELMGVHQRGESHRESCSNEHGFRIIEFQLENIPSLRWVLLCLTSPTQNLRVRRTLH